MPVFYRNRLTYLETFSQSGSHAILVFRTKQDDDISTGAAPPHPNGVVKCNVGITKSRDPWPMGIPVIAELLSAGSGGEFQTVGPETEKAWRPSFRVVPVSISLSDL